MFLWVLTEGAKSIVRSVFEANLKSQIPFANQDLLFMHALNWTAPIEMDAVFSEMREGIVNDYVVQEMFDCTLQSATVDGW